MATRVFTSPRSESQLRARSRARADGERLLVEIFQVRKRRNDAATRIAALIEALRTGKSPAGASLGPSND